LVGVAGGDRLAERLLRGHAECLHGRHIQQVDIGLGFAAEFREEIPVALFVEFDVGIDAVLRAADEVMVIVAAIVPVRVEAADIHGRIARREDGVL